MRRFLIVLLGSIALVAAVACGETGPEPEVAEPMPAADRPAADAKSQFAGAWSLVRSEWRDADGELLAPPIEDRLGYNIYAPSGHMAVHLMRPDRQPYAGDGPTPEEALMAVETYGSYFGPFSVNEAEGYLVHHRIGNENPEASGTDAQRFYELTDTHLMLRPPAGTDDQGRPVQSTIRWARISD